MPAARRAPQSAPPRWSRRAEARPEEILDAALSEFTERGFDAARMEDIAKRAGISKGAVYLYFESKEALLRALIQSKIAPLAAQAENLARAGAANPMMALKLIAAGAAMHLRDPAILAVPRLVIGLSARFPELAEFYRVEVGERARQALEGLVASGVEQGVFKSCDPRAVTRAFIGPLFFEAMWTHVLRGETAFADPSKLVETQLNLLFEGLRA
ncbi:transcriptional regulator of TetR family [alpha proteobacterium U9-1i]|nr:transcriptional regulator of TetR family [alpha proteobacterium U9-1i]